MEIERARLIRSLKNVWNVDEDDVAEEISELFLVSKNKKSQ